MNTQVAEIALMFVLPLGITFVTILMSASAATRNQKLLGTLLSLFLVAIDCIFYFMKNTIVTYNTDGGVLLAFASMFLFGILYVIRSEDSAAKAGNSIFAALMLVGFIGIAYWERPTLIITSDKSASEIAELNAKYQDYIQSFSNGEAAKEVGTSGTVVRTGTHLSTGHASTTETYENAKPGSPEAAKGRLNSYINETDKVIERMQSIAETINEFELIPPNISEADREARSQQALAINNNATALNRKTLGLFHPHSASEAHSELIQATECLRLAAYSLYTYSLQESSEEQVKQYQQARDQLGQTRVYLGRFQNNINNLVSNYQPQQEEE